MKRMRQLLAFKDYQINGLQVELSDLKTSMDKQQKVRMNFEIDLAHMISCRISLHYIFFYK